MDKKGEFEEFLSYNSGIQTKDDEKLFSIVQTCQYENGLVIYTLTFDEDQKLAQFYLN